MPKSTSARVFIALIVISGFCTFGDAILNANPIHAIRFASFLLVACFAARLRLKLPGLTGSMSVNLPFILVAVAEMSVLEALIVGCFSTVVQCLPGKQQKLNKIQAAFNFSNMALAVSATRLVYLSGVISVEVTSAPLRLCLAAAVFFLVNSIPVAIVMALTEAGNAWHIWAGIFQLSFPYFVASAGIAATVLTLTFRIGWQIPIAVLPLMLGIYHSYRQLLGITARSLFAISATGKAAAMEAKA
jgi:hypothetical protein